MIAGRCGDCVAECHQRRRRSGVLAAAGCAGLAAAGRVGLDGEGRRGVDGSVGVQGLVSGQRAGCGDSTHMLINRNSIALRLIHTFAPYGAQAHHRCAARLGESGQLRLRPPPRCPSRGSVLIRRPAEAVDRTANALTFGG